MPPPVGDKSLCSPTAAENSCEHLQNQTEQKLMFIQGTTQQLNQSALGLLPLPTSGTLCVCI